jgi:hypothetical protein
LEGELTPWENIPWPNARAFVCFYFLVFLYLLDILHRINDTVLLLWQFS